MKGLRRIKEIKIQIKIISPEPSGILRAPCPNSKTGKVV